MEVELWHFIYKLNLHSFFRFLQTKFWTYHSWLCLAKNIPSFEAHLPWCQIVRYLMNFIVYYLKDTYRAFIRAGRPTKIEANRAWVALQNSDGNMLIWSTKNSNHFQSRRVCRQFPQRQSCWLKISMVLPPHACFLTFWCAERIKTTARLAKQRVNLNIVCVTWKARTSTKEFDFHT